MVSEKGWLRAMKGHLADFSTLSFKEGDKLKLAFHAETTDKLLFFTTGGKFFTIGANTLPGAAATASRSAFWSIWKTIRIY